MAAFASSVYASRTFDIEALCYYSIFLTAFVASSNVPGRLLFFPYEIASVSRPEGHRLAFVQRGLVRATPLAFASAVVAAFLAALISHEAGLGVLVPLGVSMAAAATLSPLQDHIRRMLHVDHQSWKAVVVSAVQLFAVLASIVVMHPMQLDRVWIPYLALAGANAVSLTLGVLFVRATHVVPEAPPPFKSVARSAWWLLYLSLPGPGIGLVVNAIFLHLTDAATVGFAEAARQVARPLTVINTGLGMSMRPRSFAAAQQRRRSAARRVEKAVILTGVLLGGAYAAWVAGDWSLNVMADLIPKAYEIGGLVLAVCLSNIALGVAFPSGYELVGAGYERTASGVESLAQIGRLVVTGFAALLGSFTIAATDTALGASRFVGNRLALRQLYGDGSQDDRSMQDRARGSGPRRRAKHLKR